MRVIITFDRLPATSDQRPLSLISELCKCTPVFIRQYLGNALIYEITLLPDHTYPEFENSLLERGRILGVRAVEQDRVMQHQ